MPISIVVIHQMASFHHRCHRNVRHRSRHSAATAAPSPYWSAHSVRASHTGLCWHVPMDYSLPRYIVPYVAPLPCYQLAKCKWMVWNWLIYTVSQKKGDSILLSISLLNI